MQYRIGRLSSIFFDVWCVYTEGTAFHYEKNEERHCVDYLDIQEITFRRGIIWGTVIVTVLDQAHRFRGLPRKTANLLSSDLTSRAQEAVIARALEPKGPLRSFESSLKDFLASERYISQTSLRNWLSSMAAVDEVLANPFFDPELLPNQEQSNLELLYKLKEPGSDYVKQLNEQFVEKAIDQFSHLFQRLEAFPLSEEQMRAAVIDEDRNLLIAAAGSGKTSTIVARAIYLICAGVAKPEEILILAYNKDAQTELQQRLFELQSVAPEYQRSPQVKTFHGYGYEILCDSKPGTPQISQYATAGAAQQSELFSDLIRKLYEKCADFRSAWQEFLLVNKYSLPDVFSIKTEREYSAYLQELGAKRSRLQEGQQLMVPTIDGNEVRSIEEARIANWLAIRGVSYEYESQYKSLITPDKDFSYKPDFFYPDMGLYHEHFAINEAGKTPPFIGEEYLDGIAWKRETHQENNTILIETHSAHFRDGTVFERLENELKSNSIVFTSLDKSAIGSLLRQAFNPEVDTSLFVSFLHHYKANDATIAKIREKASDLPDRGRLALFIKIFEDILGEYTEQLAQANEIDFEDQIKLASDLLEAGKYRHQFKYVLVDEFQDTSQDRKRMLQALLDQDEKIKLFAVGDDWQSIYRFAGADIEIMTHFLRHFGATATNHLTRTYRSFAGIVDVAAQFVQCNDAQIKKNVSAIKDIEKDQVVIYGYSDTADQWQQLNALLKKLNALDADEKLSVFLLARYSHMKPKITERYRNLDLRFSTIHAAKGLQADYVVLLNVETGAYGFPSTIADDPVMQLVLPDPETYPHAEERRLMYVALTRAKRGVFIFANQKQPSPFILELVGMERVKADAQAFSRANPCPDCETGELSRKISKYGAFYGCSNFPCCEFSSAVKCPQCDTGKLVQRKAKYGPFLSCSAFPKCKYTEKLTAYKT